MTNEKLDKSKSGELNDAALESVAGGIIVASQTAPRNAGRSFTGVPVPDDNRSILGQPIPDDGRGIGQPVPDDGNS